MCFISVFPSVMTNGFFNFSILACKSLTLASNVCLAFIWASICSLKVDISFCCISKAPISSNNSVLWESLNKSSILRNSVSPYLDLIVLNMVGLTLAVSRGFMKAIECEVAKICVVFAYSSQNSVLRASAARNSREFSGSSIPQIKIMDRLLFCNHFKIGGRNFDLTPSPRMVSGI